MRRHRSAVRTGLFAAAALALGSCGGDGGPEDTQVEFKFVINGGTSLSVDCGFLRNGDLVVAVLDLAATVLEDAPGGCEGVLTGAGAANVGGRELPVTSFEARFRAAGLPCNGLATLTAAGLSVISFDFLNESGLRDLACESASETTPVPPTFPRAFDCVFEESAANPMCGFRLQASVAAGFDVIAHLRALSAALPAAP